MYSLSQFFFRDQLSKFILRATVGTLLTTQGILAFVHPESLQQLASAASFLFGCEGQSCIGLLGGSVAALTTLGGFCVLVGFYFRSACAVLFFIALSQVLFLRNSSGLPYTDPNVLYHIVLSGVALSSLFTSPGRWSADGEGNPVSRSKP
ncbi:MAG: DoxX family protein [Puniceicoccales bacterium]|jgi:uncharacterized membrane protein YphA (DoxX/SURF4 family)|nr:DoxX family protein [Puniceicoccales bacterium]